MNKIFQIGFNKCGTYSFYGLFNDHVVNKSLKAIHWDYGKLAFTIYDNLNNDKFLLHGYEHIDVFTDMEVGIETNIGTNYLYAYKLYKQLDEQYPDSRFILNTRDMNRWIQSRLNHECGWVLGKNKQIKRLMPKPLYHETQLKEYNCSAGALIDMWKKDWIDHHKDVIDYFKYREKDLLIFNIESDSFAKIQEFFKQDNLKFSTDKLPHFNKTNVES